MNRIKAASRFSLSDWNAFIGVWIQLLVADIGLRTLPFARVRNWAANGADENVVLSPKEIQDLICRYHRMVMIASRNHIYTMTCLRRSLALQRALGRRGVITSLRFGVQVEDSELKAHAWLEHDETPVGEPEALTERYAALVVEGH